MGTAGTALSELSAIMIVVNAGELALPEDYPHLLAELKAQIRSGQWTAARVVNTALIELYWAVGEAILDRPNAAGWGAKVVDQLAADLSGLPGQQRVLAAQSALHAPPCRGVAQAPHLCHRLWHKCPGAT